MNNLTIRLLVNNFDDCFEFYSEKLGFSVTWGQKGDAYASFAVNDQLSLSIFMAKLMDDHIQFPYESRNIQGDAMVITISSEDVDLEYTTLKERGVNFINIPHDMPGWGMRCVHLRDPEGNLIEFSSELSKEHWSKDLQEDAVKYDYT